MRFRVRFLRGGVEHNAFEAAPFLVPDYTYEYDVSVPPRLVAIVKTWTLEGVLYAAAGASVADAWAALRAKIEDPVAYPDAVELQKDGKAVESISVAGGYQNWRIERLSSPKTDLQWRGELRFTLVVTGRAVLGGASAPVTSVKQTETWSYDEAGLLTRTLAGEVEVASGSATAAARALGLKLPGQSFGFVTNGPEGVDVERLDPSDLRARYTSTIRESGAPLPDGCAPHFALEVETTLQGGVQVTTTRAHAVGPGALAAVQAQLAHGGLQATIAADAHGRTAQGVFVETKPARGDQLLRLHRFSVSGGNRPIAFTRRTGGRPPVDHTLSLTPVTVTEAIEVVTWGKPTTLAIKLPSPVVGLTEDKDAWSLVGPDRTVVAKDEDHDEWTTHVVRVYRAATLANVFVPVLQSVIAPGQGTTLEDELARIGKV